MSDNFFYTNSDGSIPSPVPVTSQGLFCKVAVDPTTHGLRVSSSGGGGGTSSTFGAAFPTSGTAIGVKDSAGTNQTFLKANASNALVVDGSAAIQPVSQSGTWNVVNISGTVSLPTGASTSAKQPALGTAGSSSTDVITVQGIASGTPQPVNGTVTSNQGTAISVTDSGWPVINGELTDTTGTFTNGTQTNSVTTGASTDGYDTATVTIQGTYGTASGVFEVSDDGGTTWFTVQGTRSDAPIVETGYTSLTNNARMWTVSIQGCGVFRVRSTAVASGTANVRISVSSAPTASTSAAQAPTFPIVGASAQTATVNNILVNPSSANATDVSPYQSATVQVTSTGTGGSFIFEGSNDNTNFIALPVWNKTVITGTPITAAITASASQIVYAFPVDFQYVRLRIATTITGGSIQAFSIFKQASWTPGTFQVAQATGSNLNVAVASGTVTTVSTVTSLTTLANGQTAHSSASTGSPVRVGGRVNTALDTTLVQGDASDLFMTDAGQTITKPFGAATNDWQASSGTTPLATNTSTALKAAGAASIRNYVTGLQVWNNSATVSTTISILDGASVIWTGYAPATTAALAVVPIEVVFLTPLKGTAATAMNIQCGTTGSSIFYNAQGYQSF